MTCLNLGTGLHLRNFGVEQTKRLKVKVLEGVGIVTVRDEGGGERVLHLKKNSVTSYLNVSLLSLAMFFNKKTIYM